MNTKKIIAVAAMALLIGSQQAGAQWKPVGDKIKTAWVEKVNPKMPWNVYPRPQLKRTPMGQSERTLELCHKGLAITPAVSLLSAWT